MYSAPLPLSNFKGMTKAKQNHSCPAWPWRKEPTWMPTSTPLHLREGPTSGSTVPGSQRVTAVGVNRCLIFLSLSFSCLSIWLLMHLENIESAYCVWPFSSTPYKYYSTLLPALWHGNSPSLYFTGGDTEQRGCYHMPCTATTEA